MIVRLLRESDHRRGFESGEHSLDDFFERHAWVNHVNGISRVYVAVEDQASPDVLGYYSLGAADMESSKVAPHLHFSLPRYPMPVFKIGGLAVRRTSAGRGIGRGLLQHGLRTSCELSARVAAVGVVVDALTPAAAEFYHRFGFALIPPEAQPQPMFLAMGTIRDSLPSTGRTESATRR